MANAINEIPIPKELINKHNEYFQGLPDNQKAALRVELFFKYVINYIKLY
jgi:hypothetical protein